MFKKICSLLLILTLSLFTFISPSMASEKEQKMSDYEMLETLGFDKEEVKEIKEAHKNKSGSSSDLDNIHGLKLKKKDIYRLAMFGLTKDSIENLTAEEFKIFSEKEMPNLISVDVSFSKVNKDGTSITVSEEEYKKAEKNAQEAKVSKSKTDSSEFGTMALCDVDTTCKGYGSSYVSLTVSVTHSSTYAIVSNFDWITNDSDRYSDFFGSGHKEALTIDYNSIFGSWTTKYYDNSGYVHSKTSSLGYPYETHSNGYAHKLNRNSYNHQEWIQRNGSWTQARNDEGYTYATFYWSNSYTTSSSAYTNYTHMNSSWSTAYGVSVPFGSSIAISNTTSDVKASSAAVSFSK